MKVFNFDEVQFIYFFSFIICGVFVSLGVSVCEENWLLAHVCAHLPLLYVGCPHSMA